ncbi:hypothetical protein SDC9_127540 [bioreactor metagenome]|uniref:Uncharacterized protein n=1 Tax=bioreactor metagenome TaxID=1076179 RepID=A0A645CUA8_9ZZZZ
MHRTLEAIFVEQRQKSGVVHVRMREQYRVNFAGERRQRRILIKIFALFHAIVHENAFAADFQIGTAACDLMVRADKGDFHTCWPFRARFIPNQNGFAEN